ncbi:MAG: glycosyltransferase family 39 protein [Microgenomates group bacterium]
MKDQKNQWQKIDFLILGILLFIGFVLRIYKINIPLADLHSWRQADTAAVARNFVKDGIDLLHPRFDDLSANQSAAGLENPQGWRMVEFPIYNAIFAFLYKTFPQLSLVVWGRLTTIFFSLILISIIYYLALKEIGRVAAVSSAFVYTLFPFFVFFSRVILPETTALSFSFLSIFFLYLSFKKENLINKKKNKEIIKTHYPLYFLAILFMSFGLLVKPTVIFYLLPPLVIFISFFKKKVVRNPFFYLYFILVFIPLFLWRQYIKNYPEGIPPSDWLFTSVNTSEGLKNIFFKPAFFRWIFFERINNLILGGYLTFFFFLGILTKRKNFLIHSIILSMFFYLFTFQGGNVQHEYYQTIILPAIALAVGAGVDTLINKKAIFVSSLITVPVTISVFALSLFFSYYKVKDFYYFPPELPQIALVINELTKPEDKIITDRSGDTTLLFLSERKGAPSIYKDPEQLKKIGYRYLVTTNKETIEKLKNERKYQIVFENNYFVLFRL